MTTSLITVDAPWRRLTASKSYRSDPGRDLAERLRRTEHDRVVPLCAPSTDETMARAGVFGIPTGFRTRAAAHRAPRRRGTPKQRGCRPATADAEADTAR